MNKINPVFWIKKIIAKKRVAENIKKEAELQKKRESIFLKSYREIKTEGRAVQQAVLFLMVCRMTEESFLLEKCEENAKNICFALVFSEMVRTKTSFTKGGFFERKNFLDIEDDGNSLCTIVLEKKRGRLYLYSDRNSVRITIGWIHQEKMNPELLLKLKEDADRQNCRSVKAVEDYTYEGADSPIEEQEIISLWTEIYDATFVRKITNHGNEIHKVSHEKEVMMKIISHVKSEMITSRIKNILHPDLEKELIALLKIVTLAWGYGTGLYFPIVKRDALSGVKKAFLHYNEAIEPYYYK